MSRHKITWLRSGTTNGMDWEDEQEITFEFRAGRPAKMYLRNGDPGYPADPDEIEFVSISPGAGDHGAFSDIAQAQLESEADTWLSSEGYDAAVEIAASDAADAREYAADLRADR
jgi:hypothetical protein